MFPRLALLPIGLFLIWGFVCQRWYVCHIKHACDKTNGPVIDPEPDAPDNRPIVFKWDNAEPEIRTSLFTELKNGKVNGLAEGDLFEIIGHYFADEKAPDGFSNMGLARAAKIKALFVPDLSTDRIVESSRLITEPGGIRGDTLFEAIEFTSKTPPPPDEPDNRVECVEGSDNSLTVLFPYGKAQREVDENIEKCLQSVIEHLKNTDDTANLVGHTDNDGSEDFNMGLGLRRARHIQAILVKNGIAKNRITIESKGESQPVSSNATEEGRRLNRRAILTLVQ